MDRMTFLESSSRSISLFEHDLRVNASRLSPEKTAIMLQNIMLPLQLLLPLAVVRCCTLSQLPDIKERGDKHAFSSRGFCTYAAIALAIWNIAGIGGSRLPGALHAYVGADHQRIAGV
jgi:hypothetical protein